MNVRPYHAPGHTYTCKCRACMDAKNRYQKHRRVLLEAGTPLTVDATGTRRRLQALAVMGWPATILADRIGVSRESLSQIVKQGRTRVLPSTAESVRGVFAELCMRPGPNRGTATISRRKGWAPPLAWDEIDDPADSPVGVAA